MKPKQTTASLSDLGAPAALLRLETEELKCYAAKERLEAQLVEWASQEPPFNASDDLKTQWKIAKANLEGDLLSAYKRWDITRKSLNEYDRSIKEDRREGEKILVSDAREAFAQLKLCLEIAREKYLITIAQTAPKFQGPQDFMKAHGELIRETHEGAIAAAKKEGVLPAWVE